MPIHTSTSGASGPSSIGAHLQQQHSHQPSTSAAQQQHQSSQSTQLHSGHSQAHLSQSSFAPRPSPTSLDELMQEVQGVPIV